MTPRSRTLLIAFVALAVVVLVVAAVAINSIVNATSSDDTDTSASTPTSSAPPAVSDGGGEVPVNAPEDEGTEPRSPIEESAANFLAAYTSDDASADWTKALTELTTPVMLASLATSDRDVAAYLAGTTIGTAQGTQVPVLNGGDTVATIHLVQVADDDEGIITEDSIWYVDYIDFTDPPEATALPMSSTTDREIAAGIEPAVAAVLAQPGGLTDAARKEQISAAFTDPKAAFEIKRGAGKDKRITMGGIHDVQLATDDDGNLTATVIAPWQIDGDPLVQWTTLTLTLTRDDNGAWIAADATAD